MRNIEAIIEPGKTRNLRAAGCLRRLAGVAAVAVSVASSAHAAVSFSYRKAITINQAGGRANLTDFPFVVNINGDPDLMTKVQSANGDDIMFKASDGVTDLDFEIEWFDKPSGTLIAWVKIPLLQPGANTIYMVYGSSQVTSSPATPCAVWGVDTIGVWHVGESGNGTEDEFRDSSPYANHGQGGEGDTLFVPTRVNGKLGFGQHFDNSDTKYDLIDCGDDALFDLTGTQVTLEAWIQHNITTPSAGSHGFLNHKGYNSGYRLFLPNTAAVPPPLSFQLPGRTDTLTTANGVSAGSWHHVVATYDGATMRVYVDGVNNLADQRAKSGNLMPSMAEQDFWIGHGDQPKDVAWSYEWDGDIDEVRIVRVARSADWIATEYDNQNSTCQPSSAFCSLGAEAPGSYPASPLAANYRSIGTDTSNLASAGTATATAGSTTVSFSGVTLPANVGQGDKLTLDPAGSPEVLYILSRDSDTQVTVQTPAASSRTVGYTITRAYNTLADWEKDIASGGRGGNLVAENRREIGVVYNDGPLAGVTISGSTTDCARYMKLTSPQSQRHRGKAATGAVIDNGVSATPAIQILDDYVTVEWLEIKGGSGAAADGIELASGISAANRATLQYNIIHDTGGDAVRLSDPDSIVEIFNNVIYNAANGVHLTVDMTADARVSVFNNTIYNCSTAGMATDVRQSSLRVDLRNNIAHSNTSIDFGVVRAFDRAYYYDGSTYTQIANGGVVGPNEYLADRASNYTLSFTNASHYLYLGSSWKFRGFFVELATGGQVSGVDLQWEYWNGTGWTSLETGSFRDGTANFRWNALIYWADDPAGWATTSVNGSPNLYYVRAYLASGSYTTAPVERLMTPAVNVGSRNNLASDLTASYHCPFNGGGNAQDSVPLANMNFVSTAGGVEDLHITAGSTAQDNAADESQYFFGDIDGGARTTPWDIGADDVGAVTAVELVSFEAQGLDGAVGLRWETGSELNNLGFNVYRSTSAEGPYAKLTAEPIPGLGSSPHGTKYAYRDEGLANGVTYYYKLEDVETTGKTGMHGPVSATPRAGTGPSPGGSEDSSDSVRISVGRPQDNALRVVSERPGELVLELRTEGFYATPGEDGGVRLEIPGFSLREEEGFPELPVKRSWVPVVAGRRVKLVSVATLEEEDFEGLWPENASMPFVETRRRTITLSRNRRLRAAARRSEEAPRGLYPREAAQLLTTAFQEDVKKALVEMAPLRWDAGRQRLVLAHRVVVRLSLAARERAERQAKGARGRRYRKPVSHEKRRVVGRLVTREPGLYGVRFEDVFPSRRQRPLRAEELRLSRQGRTVPFYVENGRFAPATRLYFLSPGSEANPYGDEAVFELELGVEGERMQARSASPSGEPTAFYWERVEREEQQMYQATLVDAPDRWLWSMLFAPVRESYPFEVTALASSGDSAKLSVWLQGASDFASDPDHHVRLFVNGSFVAEAFWDGKAAQRIDAELGEGLLHEGENLLEIENVGDTGARYSMVMLDRFEVAYPRRLQARGGKLQGRWSRSGSAEVEGLGPEAVVLELGEAGPVWLTGLKPTSAGVRFRAEAGRSYLAVGAQAVLRVAEVRRPAKSRLKDPRQHADYLLIGPRLFLGVVTPLVELRRREGLSVKTVALEEIFSAFGFGEDQPQAIKDFLSYTYHQWETPPRYVVLLGDATYDFKDYLGTGVTNEVPPLMVKTTYLETASDPAYAAVNGEDLLPDMAIGRLPAANVEELETMVAKILAFETSGASLRGKVVLVTDNADRAGDFVADAEELAATVLSDEELEKIYLSELGPAASRARVLQAFDAGASLMNYMGHGGIHVWAEENVFNTGDIALLGPQSEQPMLLTMNCLNGYFHFPYFDSLAEALLKADGRGAIAAFSPSGLSLNEPAHVFHVALLEALLKGHHDRLGDAVLAAQAAYADSGALPEMIAIYHLFGDPAMKLK